MCFSSWSPESQPYSNNTFSPLFTASHKRKIPVCLAIFQCFALHSGQNNRRPSTQNLIKKGESMTPINRQPREVCRSIRDVRKLRGSPSSTLALSARTYTHQRPQTPASYYSPPPTPTTLTSRHNLYGGLRWLLRDAASHFIFQHILFHLISGNSNPLNPNVRRHRAPLFGQVK